MSKRKPTIFNLRSVVLNKVATHGGWVNTHAHIDRAYSLSEENFQFSNLHLHKKWALVNTMKEQSTVTQIYDRMSRAIEKMLEQKVSAIGTFIDVDNLVKDKSIKAAMKLRDNYKHDIQIKFINGSTYKGLLDKTQKQWFDVGCEFVDIIGGLPAMDSPFEEKHLDIILSKASTMKKMVHVHVDQLNTPKETEIELLAKKTIEYGLTGRVVAIHGISLAAHPILYRKNVYALMKKAHVMLSTCPSAWIDHRRNETLTVTHNSIAPVEELIKNKIVVGLGTDNICDIYKPFSDGDMWIELRFLLESLHFYDIESLVKIATINGRLLLGIH